MAKSSVMMGYGLMVVTAVGWAISWITARAAASDAPPLSEALGRFLVASLALLPVWLILEKGRLPKFDARTIWILIGMAVTGAGIYTALFLEGVNQAPASDGAVLTPGLAGFFAMAIAAIASRKAPARVYVLGAALSVSGCLLVGGSVLASVHDATRILGDVFFVLAGATWGAYTVLGRALAHKVPAVTSIFLMSCIATVLLIPVVLVADGVPHPTMWNHAAIFNVLYLGIGSTAVCFVTFYAAVKILGIDRVAPTPGLVPLFAVAGAHYVLGDPLAWYHAVGAALVVLGILLPFLVQRMETRRARIAAAASSTVPQQPRGAAASADDAP
ncbi:MAG: DMT family transporter [Thermoplasmatota archaeon]